MFQVFRLLLSASISFELFGFFYFWDHFQGPLSTYLKTSRALKKCHLFLENFFLIAFSNIYIYTGNFTHSRLKGNCKHEQWFFSLLRSKINHKGSAVSFHTVAKEMFGDNHKNFKCAEHKFMKTTERFKQLGQLFLHLRTISTVCYCWFM